MNIMIWLMRASRWARNPPSPRTVRLVFGLLAVIALIAGIEALGLWPEALTLDRQPQGLRLPR